jgi:UDP-N-acetylmuramate--alanine ligase
MTKNWMIDNVRLNMGGMHNVENAVAAVVVALHLKIDNNKIRKAVEDFKGVKRRFEYIIKSDKVVFIDDYAHHPEELKALLTGAKTLFNEMKSTIVFQPHLFSRTRDLAKGFAESLDLADEIIILPIYPARELPIEGVSSKMILDEMKNESKQILSGNELLNWIKASIVSPEEEDSEGVLFITAGAGDIDKLIIPLKQILENKN